MTTTEQQVERFRAYRDSLRSIADQLDELGTRLDMSDLVDSIRLYRLIADDLSIILEGGELKPFMVTGVIP